MSLLTFVFTFILAFLNTQKVIAQEHVKTPSIQWFQWKIKKESKIPGVYVVQLHGMTSPGTKIQLNNSRALVVQEFGRSSGLELPSSLYKYLLSSASVNQKEPRKVKTPCHIRSKPFSRAKSLGLAKKGTRLKVMPKKNNWFLLRNKKRKMYIHGSCLVSPQIDPSAVDKIVTTSANADGRFVVSFILPPALVQVPLKFEFKNRQHKSILIVFNVSKDNVKTNLKFSPPPKPTRKKIGQKTRRKKKKGLEEPKDYANWWIEMGPLISYQKYSQTISGRDGINFSNLKIPGLIIRLGGSIKKWSFSVEATESSTKLDGAQNPYTLDPTSYPWRDLTLQSYYKFSKVKVKLGVQQKTFPFLAADDTQSVQVGSAVITNLLLGTKYSLRLTDMIDWQFAMDLQVPLSTSVKVNQTGEIDGKVGVSAETAIQFDLSKSFYISGSTSVSYQSSSISYTSGSANDSGKLDFTEGRLGVLLGIKF